jgi:hypothetical protein
MSSVYTFSRIRSQDNITWKNNDLQAELLSFQILENSTICIEKKMSTIVIVLLQNVISSCELDERYKKTKWLGKKCKCM